MKTDLYTHKEIFESIKYHTSGRRTICEVFRDIYDEIENIPNEALRNSIIELLIEGFIYGKKMNKRMVEQYKQLVRNGLLKDGDEHNLVFIEENFNKAKNVEKRIKRRLMKQ